MRPVDPLCRQQAEGELPVRPNPAASAAVPRHRRRLTRLLIAASALLAVGGAVLKAETAPQNAPTEGSATPEAPVTAERTPEVTAEQLERRIEEVEASTKFEEGTKTKLLEHLRRALADLASAQAYEAKAAAYVEDLTAAPAETATIRETLAAGAATTEAPAPAHLSLAKIERRRTQLQTETALLETELREIEQLLAATRQRPEQARPRIAEARKRLEEIDAELKLPAPESETPALTQARRWALQTAQQALWAEVRMLEQEMASTDVRIARLRARQEQTALRLKQAQVRQHGLQEALSQRRRAEARRTEAETEAAEAAAAAAPPLVQEMTRKNADLGHALTALTAELDQLGDTAARVQQQAQRIKEEFQGARQRVEVAGITHAFGQFLLDRRLQLPGAESTSRQLAERQDALTDSLLRELRYQDEHRQLKDVDAFVAEAIAAAVPAQRPLLQEQLAEAARRRVELLDQALHLEETYQRTLNELNFATAELLETIASYDAFLAERLLWVRSSQALDLAALATVPSAAAWLLGPSGWYEVARVLVHEARSSPPLWLGLAGVLALFSQARRIRTALRETAEPLRRIRTDSFTHTLKGLALTAIDALPWPLLLAVLGWTLADSPEATPFTQSIGQAALGLSVGLYLLRAFRVLCIKGGVADRHFRWSQGVLEQVRRHFDWLIALLMPFGFVAIALYRQDNGDYTASLGRIALIVLMIGFAAFFARLLHPRRGVFAGFLAEQPTSWANRLRHLWYPVIPAVPGALAVLALIGFVYTAGVLLDALVNQLWLALGIVVLHQSVVRWLMVTRRHLALRAALERQAARRAEGTREAQEDSETSALQYQESAADLSALDEQTRKLINTAIVLLGATGLWLVWRDLLPALGVFDEIALWHYTSVIDDTEKVTPFTLADLGILLLIAFIAFAAARQLPALIEILLLKQTRISAGSRYAILTLAGYAIVAAAILVIFSSLGLSWSQAQWLVAALGVGIGFGLQEIVANFISGLIILFERPVRVGDIVTIGDTTGVVTRIRIRATTIRNWDRQELLVPNKEFITGRLLNWTLTDQTNRVTVTVGVAYGSDTRQAMALLGEIAQQNEEVLDDPEPLITFEAFGDNSLMLVLRCYLASLDNRLRTITEIHQSINDKFAAAGIAIAFPQRDVHFFPARPLDIRLLRTAKGVDQAAWDRS